MGKRYREITVHGSSFEMGRQIGEEAREEIRGFTSVALERVNKTVNISASRALSVARQSAVMAKKYAPNTMDELRGIEQSSGIDIDELFFLQVRPTLIISLHLIESAWKKESLPQSSIKRIYLISCNY